MNSDADGGASEYAFGDFKLVLQPNNQLFPGRLLKDGIEVMELGKSSQACRLLVYLVRNHQEPVSNESVIVEVWPGEHGKGLRDPKASLTAVVQKVRTILDSANMNLYIERGNNSVQFIYRPLNISRRPAGAEGDFQDVKSRHTPQSANIRPENGPRRSESAKEQHNNSKRQTIEWVIVLDGLIDEMDKPRIETLAEHLRTLLKDPHLTIKQVVSGSVILTIESSAEAFAQMSHLFRQQHGMTLGVNRVLDVYPASDATQGAPVVERSKNGPEKKETVKSNTPTLVFRLLSNLVRRCFDVTSRLRYPRVQDWKSEDEGIAWDRLSPNDQAALSGADIGFVLPHTSDIGTRLSQLASVLNPSLRLVSLDAGFAERSTSPTSRDFLVLLVWISQATVLATATNILVTWLKEFRKSRTNAGKLIRIVIAVNESGHVRKIEFRGTADTLSRQLRRFDLAIHFER